MDKQREMFEAEFHLFDLRTEQDEDGDLMYIDDLTQGAWLGWKAAIAAQWQPIEAAPKVELKDLIVFNGEVQHGQWWEGYWINSFQEYMEPQPTMWHELPPEPTK